MPPGFAAVYVAALVLGNSELPHRGATRSFAEGVAWLAQIGLFVMLGLLLSPERITWTIVGLGVVAGLILTFVARPISVAVSALIIRKPMPLNELAFFSWAGLRGAVPIVLATIPLAEHVTDATRLFDIVFVLVIVYTLLTGPTLPWVAAKLKVTEDSPARALDVETAPLERIAADLLTVKISEASRMHGVEVGELRLPQGASVSLVVREGQSLVPERGTVLKHGDDLLVVTPRAMRAKTERRFASGFDGWSTGPLAGRGSRGPETGTTERVRDWVTADGTGAQISASALATTKGLPLTSPVNLSPTSTTTPAPSWGPSMMSTSFRREATSRTAGSFGFAAQISATSTPEFLGALLTCPCRSPHRRTDPGCVAPDRLASLPLKTLTTTSSG